LQRLKAPYSSKEKTGQRFSRAAERYSYKAF
jgi:hypothetical protein